MVVEERRGVIVNTIQSQWEQLEEKLVRLSVPGPSPKELDSMRKIFFLGAGGVLNMQAKIAASCLSSEATRAIHSGWLDELDAVFNDDLKT